VAASEAAEVASTTTPPAQEGEPEVVLGRRLLPSPAEVPLPRLFAKSLQVHEELEAGIRREWERLKAERHRLLDWEQRLGDCIKSVTARYADERAKLVLERELLQEQLQQALNREAAAAQRERAAVRREADALERELLAETRVQAAAEREKISLELAEQAKKVVEKTAAQEATLAELTAAAAKREEELTAREAEEVARLEELQEREAAVEKELAAGTRRLRECEAALQEREAKVEEFQAERSASIGRIVRWAGEVNSSLEALRANPIWVAETPSSLSVALQVLDSTAERLQGLESGMLDLLETEGKAVARGMAEYILTSFRSHDPAIQLTPILVGPIRATAAAAKERVQEATDMVVSRIRRRPDTSGPPGQ
jgi:chromosome segregation ATPase